MFVLINNEDVQYYLLVVDQSVKAVTKFISFILFGFNWFVELVAFDQSLRYVKRMMVRIHVRNYRSKKETGGNRDGHKGLRKPDKSQNRPDAKAVLYCIRET